MLLCVFSGGKPFKNNFSPKLTFFPFFSRQERFQLQLFLMEWEKKNLNLLSQHLKNKENDKAQSDFSYIAF